MPSGVPINSEHGSPGCKINGVNRLKHAKPIVQSDPYGWGTDVDLVKHDKAHMSWPMLQISQNFYNF